MTVLAPIITLALSALTAAAPAAMDPGAKERFERGLSGYAAQEYADAVKDFRVAYALDPRPEILFAWAQAERMYGRCSQATKLYVRFIKSKPSDQQAEAARTGLERCKDQPDTTPGDPEDEDAVEPEEEEEEPVAVEMPPEPEPSPPPPRVDAVGISLLGAGVALGVTGGALLGVGEHRAGQLGEVADYNAHSDGVGQIRALRIAGGLLAGVGGALLVGGIVKLLVHRRQSRRDLAFWTEPRGAGMIVRLRF